MNSREMIAPQVVASTPPAAFLFLLPAPKLPQSAFDRQRDRLMITGFFLLH